MHAARPEGAKSSKRAFGTFSYENIKTGARTTIVAGKGAGDEDSDDEDNELAFDRAIGSSFKQNRKNSKNTSPTHRQYSDEDFSANYERN